MAIEFIRPKDLPAASEVNENDSIPVDDGSAVGKATPKEIVDAGRPVASQSEAEQGTRNDVAMTPLTTAQAIVFDGAGIRSDAIAARNAAEDYRDEAEGFRDEAGGYAAAAGNAAGNAAGSAAEAQTYRNQTITYRDAALNGANSAGQFASDAEDAKELAQAWAESPDAPGDPGTKSAKTWAEDAEESAASLDALSFETRSDFVSAQTGSAQWKEGAVVYADGLAYRRKAGATDIPDLPGWEPANEVNAAHYGFDAATGTASENRDAIAAAVTLNPGKKVFVDVPVDWECGFLETNEMPVIVEFRGTGRRQGGNWNCRNSYEAIQAVSSISNTSLSLHGMSTSAVAMVVSDASAYSRGDVMRIVSDDINPEARDGYTARYGEDFIVGHTNSSTNTVYAFGQLEFFDNYQTNIRIARLPVFEVDIRNYNVDGVGNTSRLLTVGPHYRPRVQGKFFDCSYNAFGSMGNLEGRFDIYASFVLTGSYDDLQYGVLESHGSRNVYQNLTCFGARHAYTTGYNSVAAGSENIHSFGPPRDNAVIEGRSTSGTNSPWDDHEGGVRSAFIRCESLLPHRGSGATWSAFQARGRDMQITDCNTGPGFEAIVYNHRKASGTIVVRGGMHQCPALSTGSPSPGEELAGVVLDGLSVRTAASTGMINAESCNVLVQSGRYEYTITADHRRLATLSGGRITFAANPVFSTRGAGNTFRFCHLGDGAWALGEFTIEIGHTGSNLRCFRTNSTASFAVEFTQFGGGTMTTNFTEGSGTYLNEEWVKHVITGGTRVTTTNP